MFEENSKLRDSLVDKDLEVSSLKNRIIKLTAESVLTENVLSKNNRHLAAEIQALETKLRTNDHCNLKLEKLLKEKNFPLEEMESIAASSTANTSEILAFSDKLEEATKKVFEVLNQNTQLKNELKMAHKCLQLKSGVEASRLPMKRLENLQRLEVANESLTKELENCKIQLEHSKHEHIGSQIRNKNLTDEVNNYKLKLLDLLEKSTRDEDFIKCLNEQTSMMRKEVENSERQRCDSEHETEKLRCQIQNQEEQLREKEHEISIIKMSMGELEKEGSISFDQQLNEATSNYHKHDKLNNQRTILEAKLKEFDADKEALKSKSHRTLPINEYSQSRKTALSDNSSRSNDNPADEIDKYKFFK